MISSVPVHIVRVDHDAWEKSGHEGVWIRRLRTEDGRVTQLLRMQPGARLPLRRAADLNECYVLRGVLVHRGEALYVGDYQWAPTGALIGPFTTDEGCVLLIHGSSEDEEVPGPGPRDARR